MNKKELLIMLAIVCLPIILVCIYLRLQWYDSIARLSEDDLMWMEAYETGDTIFFMEELSGREDTLIIIDNGIETYSLPFSPNPFNWLDTYQGMGLTDMTLKHNCISYDMYTFFILKIDDQLPCYVSWSLMGLISNDDSFDTLHIKDNKLKSGTNPSLMELVVGGKSFEDCIIGNKNNSSLLDYRNFNNLEPLYATEFIWSKRYGLLQYQIEGETYTRTDIENLKSRPPRKTESSGWLHSQTFKDLRKFVRNHLRL